MTLSLLSKPLLSLFIIYITQYLMYGLCSSISNPKLFFSVKRKRKNFDLRFKNHYTAYFYVAPGQSDHGCQALVNYKDSKLVHISPSTGSERVDSGGN